MSNGNCHFVARGLRASAIAAVVLGAVGVFGQNTLVVDESYYEGVGAPLSGAAAGQPTAMPAGHEITMSAQAGRVSVLVHFDPALAPGANPRANIRAFAANNNGVVRHEYRVVMPNVMNLRNVPQGKLNALRNMPGVTRVDIDEWHPNLVSLHDATVLVNGLQSQIAAAGLSADGAGIRVCVCDTGIDSDHVMYASRIDTAAGFDFHNNDPDPEDDNGHGSHVSGIAVGGVGLNVDFGCGAGPQALQGMAPAATLIGAKILNSGGGGFDSNIIAGIDYCADQSPSGGRADVINLSIGTGNFTSGACTHSWAVASNNAVANGVVVVAASGNENNSNSMGSPACGADVIAVGAVYKADYPTCEDNTTNWLWGSCNDFGPVQDQIVCFSNESDFLDVSAPGANVWSASNAAGGSSITGKSGTSMASPMVAGLAALILSADPTLTPAEVRQIIRDGAVDLGPAGFDRAYGFGRIDAIGSLQLVGPGCTTNADCNDANDCTTDTCVGGLCQNNAVADDTSCSGGVCCGGSCTASTCSLDSDCDDADACTTDTCNGAGSCAASCSNTPISCPVGEACVGGVCQPQVCNNNGTCDAGEDCNNCAGDCISGTSSGAVCGNNICEAGNGENCVTCAADCNGKQSGKPSSRFCCGDGGGTNPLPCSDSACTSGGNTCTDIPASGATFCCGDTVCEGNEDSNNCAVDCGAPAFCGDGTCDAGEDTCNCAADCGSPAPSETNCSNGVDDDCDGATDCNDTDCSGDPACSCGGNKASCSVNSDCCSNNCKNGSCKGG